MFPHSRCRRAKTCEVSALRFGRATRLRPKPTQLLVIPAAPPATTRPTRSLAAAAALGNQSIRFRVPYRHAPPPRPPTHSKPPAPNLPLPPGLSLYWNQTARRAVPCPVKPHQARPACLIPARAQQDQRLPILGRSPSRPVPSPAARLPPADRALAPKTRFRQATAESLRNPEAHRPQEPRRLPPASYQHGTKPAPGAVRAQSG